MSNLGAGCQIVSMRDVRIMLMLDEEVSLFVVSDGKLFWM